MIEARPPAALWALLVGFLAVLAAYVVLTLNGHDASGLVSAVLALVGAAGVGVHSEVRIRQQNAVLAKVDRQTNGVLDQRIREGSAEAVSEVLRRAGYHIPEA